MPTASRSPGCSPCASRSPRRCCGASSPGGGRRCTAAPCSRAPTAACSAPPCSPACSSGRERADGRRFAALAIASSGVALVLLGGGVGDGTIDPLGAALALGAAVAYTAYILTADRTVAGTSPLAVAAMVCTGAFVTFTLAALALGDLTLGRGVGWAVAIAVVSTVMPLAFLFAGLARIGPTTASIVSTIEPPVTVGLAFLVLGETLGAIQLAGGALVLAAVVMLQLPRRAAVPRGECYPSRA